MREPYRIEGKKTMGLELAEQLQWSLPDAVIYPCGRGVGVIGMWRAFHQLLELGGVRGTPSKMIIIQAEGCAPLARAYQAHQNVSAFWEGAAAKIAGQYRNSARRQPARGIGRHPLRQA